MDIRTRLVSLADLWVGDSLVDISGDEDRIIGRVVSKAPIGFGLVRVRIDRWFDKVNFVHFREGDLVRIVSK